MEQEIEVIREQEEQEIEIQNENISIEVVNDNYEDLENLPQINNVELIGNLSSQDLGLQPAGDYALESEIPTKTSELINDSDFITPSYHDDTKQNIVDENLTTVNKTITSAINEVNSIAKGANQAVGYINYQTMITALNSLNDKEYIIGQNIYIVSLNVPDLWISEVMSSSSIYTYVDDATFINELSTNGYVQVGYYKLSALETQKVDLTNYVKNTDYATDSVGGVIKTQFGAGTYLYEGKLQARVANYSTYNALGDTSFIGKGTLENVISGKGLVSNTNYATSSQGGVIKTGSLINVNSNGVLYGTVQTFSQYSAGADANFISKGTLENVLNGKGLLPIVTLTQAEYDALTTKDPDTYYYIEES